MPGVAAAASTPRLMLLLVLLLPLALIIALLNKVFWNVIDDGIDLNLLQYTIAAISKVGRVSNKPLDTAHARSPALDWKNISMYIDGCCASFAGSRLRNRRFVCGVVV